MTIYGLNFSEGNCINLEMLRNSGSFLVEKCVKAVEAKLKEFRIIIEKHIIACITVAASMIIKILKIMNCEYQLCYKHAIHLAVCDIL